MRMLVGEFLSPPQCRVFFVTTKEAGEGLFCSCAFAAFCVFVFYSNAKAAKAWPSQDFADQVSAEVRWDPKGELNNR